MDLTTFDYQLLDFINKHEPVTKVEILERFKSKIDTVEYRLGNLSKPIFVAAGRPLQSNYIVEEIDSQPDNKGGAIVTKKGIYRLSDIGKKTLQDYKLEKQTESRRKQEERIWRAIPIIISVIALVISGLALAKSFNWL